MTSSININATMTFPRGISYLFRSNGIRSFRCKRCYHTFASHRYARANEWLFQTKWKRRVKSDRGRMDLCFDPALSCSRCVTPWGTLQLQSSPDSQTCPLIFKISSVQSRLECEWTVDEQRGWKKEIKFVNWIPSEAWWTDVANDDGQTRQHSLRLFFLLEYFRASPWKGNCDNNENP